MFYDGDCYYCDNYAEFVKINSIDEVNLISLRGNDPRARVIIERGYNVNASFVVTHNEKVFVGAEGFAYLNALIKGKNLFTEILANLTGIEILSKLIYPILVFCRYILLVVQGLSLINTNASKDNQRRLKTMGIRMIRLTPLLLSINYFVFSALDFTTTNIPSGGIANIFFGSLFAGFYLILFFKEQYAIKLYSLLRYANYRGLIIFLIIWLSIVSSCDLVIERRFLGLWAGLPLLGVFFRSFP